LGSNLQKSLVTRDAGGWGQTPIASCDRRFRTGFPC